MMILKVISYLWYSYNYFLDKNSFWNSLKMKNEPHIAIFKQKSLIFVILAPFPSIKKFENIIFALILLWRVEIHPMQQNYLRISFNIWIKWPKTLIFRKKINIFIILEFLAPKKHRNSRKCKFFRFEILEYDILKYFTKFQVNQILQIGKVLI